MATLWLLKVGFVAFARVLETCLKGIGLEATQMEGVIAVCFHEHAHVARLLILRRDRVLAVGASLSSIEVVDDCGSVRSL